MFRSEGQRRNMGVYMHSPARERDAGRGSPSPSPVPSSSGSGSVQRVKVALRTRPLLPQEKIQKARECLYPEADKSQVTFGRDRAFAFDAVFDQNSQQVDVFKVSRHCQG